MLARAGTRAGSTLWLVPTERARDQVRRELDAASVGAAADHSEVLTWQEFWRRIADETAERPIVASAAGARAALIEAIGRARRDRRLGPLGPLADAPGLHRELARRIAGWTRAGTRSNDADPGSVEAACWAVHQRYQAILRQLDAVDEAGLGPWAARVLASPSFAGRLPERLIVHSPPIGDSVVWKAIEALADRVEDALFVLLPYGRHAACEAIRARLLKRGFVEEVAPDASPRSAAGFANLVALLTSNLEKIVDPEDVPNGLRFLEAPRGEGQAVLIARQVRDLLDGGAAPNEVLVMVPVWDEQAERIQETLETWRIPCDAPRRERLGRDPAVAALLHAVSIPVEDWESGLVIALLRNRLVRPLWGDVQVPDDLTITASALRDCRVFRDRAAILEAIARRAAEPDSSASASEHRRSVRRRAEALRALPVFRHLAEAFAGHEGLAPWWVRVEWLRRLANELALTGTAVEQLFDMLAEYGFVLAELGREAEFWSGLDFLAVTRQLAGGAMTASDGPRRQGVGLATVDEAAGTSAAHVILANLTEGSFPAREVIERELAEDQLGGPGYQRELHRFLTIIGGARRSLTLAYPHRDEKGQTLLAAGFLEDVRRCFRADSIRASTDGIERAESVLAELRLCGSDRDQRIRAVALACRGETDELRRLAERESQRPALEGAAATLAVSGRRNARHRKFTRYEGRFSDPKVIGEIQRKYSESKPIFSASQLESIAFCPFQYFQKHVLNLEPIDERDEFGLDHSGHGRMVHATLEALHSQLRDLPAADGESLSRRVDDMLTALVDQEAASRERPGASGVERTLHRIEIERLRRLLRRYADQFSHYNEGEDGRTSECRHCEVRFGHSADSLYPALTLGPEGEGIQLQGTIDRVDLVTVGDTKLFRVIDYKTGRAPSKSEVMSGAMLQLPLYTLAVRAVGIAGADVMPLDAGYWALRESGYKAVATLSTLDGDGANANAEWEEFEARLIAYVMELVARIRGAEFPVQPRSADCTRTCDYRGVCRIAQVRQARKEWPRAPILGPPP